MSLTSNMLSSLRELNRIGHVPADKGLKYLPKGIHYNSLQALVKRELVETYETGETWTSRDGNVIRYRDFRLTDDGRKVIADESEPSAIEAGKSERLYRAQVEHKTKAKQVISSRGLIHYGCQCKMGIFGIGEFERYAAALVAAGSTGLLVETCPKSDPIEIPENWLYMAKHAGTETARAYWRKKCGIIETES